MKKLLTILFMALGAFVVGCDQNKPSPAPDDPESINAIKSSYTIGADGGQLELQVNSNVTFSVTCSESWIKYSTTKAAETKTIVVTVEANTLTASRTAKVVVKGTQKTVELTITQEGATPPEPDVLEAGTTVYNIPAEGQTVDVAVTTNVEMSVSVNQNWVKYVATKAASKKTVQFTVEANPGYDERVAKATISGGDKSVEIEFRQAGKEMPDPDRLEIATSEYSVGASGGDVTVKVKSNTTVTASSDADWVREITTKSAREMTEKSFTFNVSQNPNNAVRTATVTFTAGDQSAKITINQTAGEEPVIGAGQATYNVKAEGENIEIDITTNVNYTVSCDVDWISQVQTKATRTERLTFTVAANSADARTGKIKFNYGDITVIVTVNQDAYVAPEDPAVLDLSATESNAPAAGETVKVKVTHNYDVTLSGVPEWISYTAEGEDYTFAVAENKTAQERSAEIVFASKSLTKTFFITQAAASGNEDPLEVGSNLSVNETANTYVVTKAGEYTFSAAVMGNGADGFLPAWTEAIESNPDINFHLYPESCDYVTFSSDNLRKAKAYIVWEDGDCIDGDPSYVSADKVIKFKTNGNKGAALIALEDRYGEILWSWLIWCTDRPAEFTYTNKDGENFTMLDRNVGATAASPDEWKASYGYFFNFGRKDPIRSDRDFAHNGFMTNSSGDLYESVLNPTKAFYFVGRDMEWFNGSVGSITPDLWGDAYIPCTHAIRANYETTELEDLQKTIYDPCPPGYMVPSEKVFSGIKESDIETGSKGVYINVTGGRTFYPYAGYMDQGNSHGKNSGYYGYVEYPGPIDGDSDRSADYEIKVWTSAVGDYPGSKGDWLAAKAFSISYDAKSGTHEIHQTTDSNGQTYLEACIRVRLQSVRCMRYIK